MNRIQFLLLQHLRNQLSADEQRELEAWLDQSSENRALFNQINDPEHMSDQLKRIDAFSEDRVREKMDFYRAQVAGAEDEMPEKPRSSKRFSGGTLVGMAVKSWVAAALVLFIAGAGAYIWLSQKALRPDELPNGQTAKNVIQADIQAGEDGAILTLADGTQIVLDTAGHGIIAEENGAELQLGNGRLSYTVANSATSSSEGLAKNINQWHTLTTPKGRQFSLFLPDGSKVWLNAASSIRFPVSFSNKERKVEITGEAYFEIAPAYATKNKSSGLAGSGSSAETKIPFIVTTRKQAVEVLGTQFNVNAYDDEEAEKTTLLEGSVKVSSLSSEEINRGTASTGVLIRPGQQIDISGNGKIGKARNVQTEQVVAWKNGYFRFESNSVSFIMKQAARWYDVEVIYEGRPPVEKLSGEIPRAVPLSQFMEMLQFTGIQFSVEGKRIIVKGKSG